jgi:phosphoglycolate phosphatase
MVSQILVIFDCDGVLVDSEPISNRIAAKLLSEEGICLPYEEVIRSCMGLSQDAVAMLLRQRFGISLNEQFFDELRRRTFASFDKELQPVDGIEDALIRIDFAKCVASSSDHDKIRKMLELTGLLSQFTPNLFSATDVAHGKPAPDLFLYAAERMGAVPSDCFVIEDSAAGVLAGTAAGMTVFGYAKDSHSAALSQSGAKLIFDDMRKLPDLLKGRGHCRHADDCGHSQLATDIGP